jgi:hypothetical protein
MPTITLKTEELLDMDSLDRCWVEAIIEVHVDNDAGCYYVHKWAVQEYSVTDCFGLELAAIEKESDLLSWLMDELCIWGKEKEVESALRAALQAYVDSYTDIVAEQAEQQDMRELLDSHGWKDGLARLI